VEGVAACPWMGAISSSHYECMYVYVSRERDRETEKNKRERERERERKYDM